jgi:hypothetical protein
MSDLALLDQVELHFVLADSDSKLEVALDKFLIPTIRKLATNDHKVSHKVMKICSHLNVRLNNNTLKLPLDKLLDSWVDLQSNHQVTTFVLIYLEMALKRCPILLQISHLSRIISQIPKRQSSLLPKLFSIIIPIMAEYPSHSRELKSKLTNISEEPVSAFEIDDIRFILEKLYYLALYYAPVILPGTALNPSVEIPTATHIPHSLSKKSVDFITNGFKTSWCKNAKELSILKVYFI